MTPEQLERLRQVRLYHWQQVLHCRSRADSYRHMPNWTETAAIWDREANEHLYHVQTLNYFFDTAKGDTAERDAQ